MILGKHHQLTLNQLTQLAETCQRKVSDIETISKNIVRILQNAVQFDAAWVLKVMPGSLNIENIFLYHFSQSAFSRYLDEYYTNTPVPTIRQVQQEGFISRKGTHLIENKVWVKHPFYKNILEPIGLHFFLSAALINPKNEYTGYLVLWRSTARHDFSNQETFLIEQASIHCGTLLSQPLSPNPDTGVSRYVQMVSKRNPPAVIILDRENKFLFINEEARTILKILQSGRALLKNNAHDLFFEKLFQVREDGRPGVFSFRGTFYSCRPVPLDETSSARGNMMMLIETVNEDSGSSSSVEESFPELSPREKTVAKLLAQGLTNKEIANKMEIGLYTVKDHIKKIMEKLDTNTRAGVVSRLKKAK